MATYIVPFLLDVFNFLLICTLSSDEETIQIPSILKLQSSKLCHQSHHCRRLHSLKSLLQKLPSLCSVSDAVISHTIMSHQHEGCCIYSQCQMATYIVPFLLDVCNFLLICTLQHLKVLLFIIARTIG